MSRPQRFPLDNQKFREQYLAILKQEIQNDQLNLNANRLFAKTGQVNLGRPVDIRTTTEKEAGIEVLRVSLREALKKITSADTASQIVQQLSNDQVRFALNKFLIIEKDMKERYALGVPSQVFIAYLNELIGKYEVAQGVETGLQETTDLLTNTQIEQGLPQIETLRRLVEALQNAGRITNTIATIRLVEGFSRLIMTPEDLAFYNRLPPETRARTDLIRNDLYRDFPDNRELLQSLSNLIEATEQRDIPYIERTLLELNWMLYKDQEVFDEFDRMKQIILDTGPDVEEVEQEETLAEVLDDTEAIEQQNLEAIQKQVKRKQDLEIARQKSEQERIRLSGLREQKRMERLMKKDIALQMAEVRKGEAQIKEAKQAIALQQAMERGRKLKTQQARELKLMGAEEQDQQMLETIKTIREKVSEMDPTKRKELAKRIAKRMQEVPIEKELVEAEIQERELLREEVKPRKRTTKVSDAERMAQLEAERMAQQAVEAKIPKKVVEAKTEADVMIEKARKAKQDKELAAKRLDVGSKLSKTKPIAKREPAESPRLTQIEEQTALREIKAAAAKQRREQKREEERQQMEREERQTRAMDKKAEQAAEEPASTERLLSLDQFKRLENQKLQSAYLQELIVNSPDPNISIPIKRTQKGKVVIDKKTKKGPSMHYYNVPNMIEAYDNFLKTRVAGEGLKKTIQWNETKPKPPNVSRKGKIMGHGIAHLIEKKAEKPKLYAPFGRYYIQKMKLDDNILMFKNGTGLTPNGLPTQRVSRALGNVIHSFVKDTPNFDEIVQLNQEDKRKLVEITKKCQIMSPLIPKLKTDTEQEDDRFEVLRGQLIAGNDNKQLAKEFKVLLLKMVNEGRIPKRQANEILHELLMLDL